jgi:hypothetical protein
MANLRVASVADSRSISGIEPWWTVFAPSIFDLHNEIQSSAPVIWMLAVSNEASALKPSAETPSPAHRRSGSTALSGG